MIQPIQRSPNVVHFTISMIMFPVAQAGAAKIEAQHREGKTVQRFHGVKDHLVMKRSTVERMGMAHQSGARGLRSASIEQRFEAASRTV